MLHFILIVRRFIGKDQAAGGHEHTAHSLAEGGLDALDLVGCLSSDLAHRFLHGEHPVHSGVGVGQAASIGVERELAAG